MVKIAPWSNVVAVVESGLKAGAPGEIRTRGLRFRKPSRLVRTPRKTADRRLGCSDLVRLRSSFVPFKGALCTKGKRLEAIVGEHTLTGVSGHFSAAHRGPDGTLHGHTWRVLAWFENPGRADARCQKAALETLLSLWDHTTLPEELAWGEDIARAVGTLVNCVEVVVSREAEGFYARWVA